MPRASRGWGGSVRALRGSMRGILVIYMNTRPFSLPVGVSLAQWVCRGCVYWCLCTCVWRGCAQPPNERPPSGAHHGEWQISKVPMDICNRTAKCPMPNAGPGLQQLVSNGDGDETGTQPRHCNLNCEHRRNFEHVSGNHIHLRSYPHPHNHSLPHGVSRDAGRFLSALITF